MGVPWGIRRFSQQPGEDDLAKGRALGADNYRVVIPGPDRVYQFQRKGWADDGTCVVEMTEVPGAELRERLATLRFPDGTREDWEALRGWANGQEFWHGRDDLEALERHATDLAADGATESLRALAAEVAKAAAFAGRNWLVVDISS